MNCVAFNDTHIKAVKRHLNHPACWDKGVVQTFMLSHTRANTELFPSRSHGFRSDMRCKDTTEVLYCDDFYHQCERRNHSVNHITKTTINFISKHKHSQPADSHFQICTCVQGEQTFMTSRRRFSCCLNVPKKKPDLMLIYLPNC